MNILQEIQEVAVKKKVPTIEPGLTVRVHQRIKEVEKERIQIFEGLVIQVNSGHGADKTFTVRKIIGGIGVEKIFTLYSTNIEKIEVKKRSKVRRAKLYYMRERSGKSARLKESFVSEKEMEDSIEELAEQKVEEAKDDATIEASEDGVVTEAEKQEIEDTTEEKPEEKIEEVEESPKEEKTEEKEEAPKEEEKKAE